MIYTAIKSTSMKVPLKYKKSRDLIKIIVLVILFGSRLFSITL